LLVMDYQNGIVGMLAEPQELLQRAVTAVAVARERGVTVGYVRVAFTDADYQAGPATSRMGAQVIAAGRSLHADSPETATPRGSAGHRREARRKAVANGARAVVVARSSRARTRLTTGWTSC